jgi:hypothetical protein
MLPADGAVIESNSNDDLAIRHPLTRKIESCAPALIESA